MSGIALSTGELLRCFFSECERHFRFLEERYGYSFFYGLAEYEKNYKIIKPFDNHDIDGSFIALTRYEKDDYAMEILYGSDQFYVEGFAYYSPIERFEFSEMLAAAKRPDEKISGDWGLTNTVLLEKTVREIARNFEKNARILLDPGSKLLDRANTMQHMRLEHALRRLNMENMKNHCQDAARAFREKNYRLVIKLLEPYRPYLKRGDLKKLERAKKYLLS